MVIGYFIFTSKLKNYAVFSRVKLVKFSLILYTFFIISFLVRNYSIIFYLYNLY